MQNSNLSSKIFPIIKDDWSNFIKMAMQDLEQMMSTYNNDKRKLKDLSRINNKKMEIINLCKDNIEEIINYKELFMYIDNSLESSFDALNFFKEQGNFDNTAVKTIYNKIINSARIMEITSDYNRLQVKVGLDGERIKKLGELIRGGKIDYGFIMALLEKYKFDNNAKKNVLFYATVMLSFRQNEIKNKKEIQESRKEEKRNFYQERFNELVNKYHETKEKYKDLISRCYNVRSKMKQSDIDMCQGFINNPEDAIKAGFDNENMFKVYTLAFFKLKKDIENYIEGIRDLLMDDKDLDDELVFFNEMIGEFDNNANSLTKYFKNDKETDDEINSNVYFALDAFNRVLISELLNERNISSVEALLRKVDNVDNSRIEGVKTYHMLGVSDEEKKLGRNISMLATSKLKLAYVMVNKNVLIIGGTDNNGKLDRVIRSIINKNNYVIQNQIALIENENLDYIELQNRIISNILGEKTKVM